jgi:hypothetical protein
VALINDESLEWVIAGPFGVMAILGRDIGITYSVKTTCPPPFFRRLAGSSRMDAERAGTAEPPNP